MLDEILNIKNNQTFFGKILGCGAYSVAIKVSQSYIETDTLKSLKDPVLIITVEKEKINIIKELFGEDMVSLVNLEDKYNVAKEDWLDNYGYSSENDANENNCFFEYANEANEFDLYSLYKELSEKNFFYFYMEACEDFKTSETKMIEFIFEDLELPMYNSDFFKDFSTGLTLHDIAISIKERKSTFPDEVSSNFISFVKKVHKLLKITEDNIQAAAKRISLSGLHEDLSLDIHNEQFLKYNGKVVCADPFIFEDSFVL